MRRSRHVFSRRIVTKNERDCYSGKRFLSEITEYKRSGQFLQKLLNYWTGVNASKLVKRALLFIPFLT